MNFKDLKEKFIESKKENFPVYECTNNTDENIFEGDRLYLCLLVDIRFPGECSVNILRPYYYKENENKYFAWFDKHGNCYDNYASPVNMDNLIVIGFSPYEEDDNEKMKENIDEIWNIIKEKYKNQE